MTPANDSATGFQGVDDYPALHYTLEANRQTLVQVAPGFVGVQEVTESREYDAAGRLRYERIERRSSVVPVDRVPVDRVVRHGQHALGAGEESSVRRVLAGLELAERASANGIG